MILRSNNFRRPAPRRGVTLVELLVVAAIVLIMAGAATLALLKYMDDAKEDRARIDIQTISQAVKTYISKKGNPPDDLTLVLLYIDNGNESHLMDPWGNRYQYRMDTGANGGATVVVFTTTPEGKQITSVDR